MVLARGPHPFPFRTRKLSLSAPMVLGSRDPGRVGRRRISLHKQVFVETLDRPLFFTFGSWVSRLRADPHNQNEKGPGGNPRAFPRFTPNHTHKTAGARQFRRSAPDWPLPLREAAVHDGSATWLPRQRSGAANQLPSGLCGWLGRRSRLHYGKYWPKLGHPRACRR